MASILDTIDRPFLGQRRHPRIHPLERIASKVSVDPETGCHLWTGHISNEGYGSLSVTAAGYKPQTFSAHKAAYELTHGRIPDGMVLDHLCRTRHCVNPDHLEMVTQRENVMRSPIALGALNAAKTHCPSGHEYTPENTTVYERRSPKRTTMRICKACKAAYDARRSAARRAVSA